MNLKEKQAGMSQRFVKQLKILFLEKRSDGIKRKRNGDSDYIAFYGILSKMNLIYCGNRRGNMISVKPCGDNTFSYTLESLDKVTGKRKRIVQKGFKTKNEAMKAAEAKLKEM